MHAIDNLMNHVFEIKTSRAMTCLAWISTSRLPWLTTWHVMTRSQNLTGSIPLAKLMHTLLREMAINCLFSIKFDWLKKSLASDRLYLYHLYVTMRVVKNLWGSYVCGICVLWPCFSFLCHIHNQYRRKRRKEKKKIERIQPILFKNSWCSFRKNWSLVKS